MREATLGGLSPLDDTRPRKPGAGKPPGPGRGKTRPREGRWARFRRIRSRVTLIVGSAGFSAIMIGIVLNATVMQKGHHPAPLFAGAAAPAEPVAPPPVAAPAPVVAAPPATDPIAALADPPPAPVAPAPVLHHAVPAAPAAHRAKPADDITRLLASHAGAATGKAAAHSRPQPAHPAAPAAGQPMVLHPAPAPIAAKPKRSLPVAAHGAAAAVN